MARSAFEAPIPGQSLTRSPKNQPWERPPETADPGEALEKHLDRLSNKKLQNAFLDSLEEGIPVSMFTKMLTTSGVANGIHSIDVSLIIAPVLHEYLVNLADASSIPYQEFFEDEDDTEKKAMARAAREVLGQPKSEKQDVMIDEAIENDEMEDPMPMEEGPPVTGLGAKRGMTDV